MAPNPAPGSVHRQARSSRGYVPIDVETLRDRGLSDSAMRLLMLMRRTADERQSDGLLDDPDVDGLGVSAGLTVTRTRRLRAELVDRGYLDAGDGRVRDVRFGEWCKTAAIRASDRARWERFKERKAGELPT